MIPETMQYDMGWWRGCETEQKLMFGTLKGIGFGAETQSIVVIGTEKKENNDEGDGNEGGEQEEAEEKYVLFRNNNAAKSVWDRYRALKGGKNNKGDEEDGEGGDRDGDVFEYTILYIARLYAWLMNVLECMVIEGTSGGQRQKAYVETLQEFLPIANWQLSEDLYNFVK